MLKGEVGILTDVKMHDLASLRMFLYIEHADKQYIGCLFLDDWAFCQQIYDFLRNCIGMTITDIGDTDLSQTL